jgi:hypothetical protein
MNEIDALLLALADADAEQRPERPEFLVLPGMSPLSSVPVQHPALPEDFRCAAQSIDELDDRGYVRRRDLGPAQFAFSVTEAGLLHAARLKAAAEPDAGAAHGVDWDDVVLPVLQAVGRAYPQRRPGLGVSLQMVNAELGKDEGDVSTAQILDELVRMDYLEETITTDNLPGPAWCRLREKGLQVTAGWPSASGEVALARLLAIVDERIADAVDEEERSKWERFRDGVLGVGRDVMVGVMTTSVNAAAKGLMS